MDNKQSGITKLYYGFKDKETGEVSEWHKADVTEIENGFKPNEGVIIPKHEFYFPADRDTINSILNNGPTEWYVQKGSVIYPFALAVSKRKHYLLRNQRELYKFRPGKKRNPFSAKHILKILHL